MWKGPTPKKPKPGLDQPITKRLEWWINSSKDRTLASEFVAHVLGDVPWDVFSGKSKYHGYGRIPMNTSDFGTCYRLLELIPEWKDELDKIRIESRQLHHKHKQGTSESPSLSWVPIIEQWDELTAHYCNDSAKCHQQLQLIMARRKN